MGTQLVWFKRDLRVHDHAPLAEAAEAGPVIALYVYEPEWFMWEEFDPSHLRFVNECLEDLDGALRARGGRLITRVGDLPAVFDVLHGQYPFEAIWSHEETGNWITYQRDLRVQAWCAEKGVAWHERMQTGVVRRLKDRDGWSRRWYGRMSLPQVSTPDRIETPQGLRSAGVRRAEKFGLVPTEKVGLQAGGEVEAREVLDSFLAGRGVNYRKDMSSPVTAWEGCSRLSPYLAYGAVSMKTVHQALEARRRELREMKKADPDAVDKRWLGSLSSFAGRLRWHCHFMQKLEDEPRIEFENMARVYDGLREEAWKEARFQAWCAGQTGYPMVDACIRALHARSWINFRMRAMLMSFSSYHLWLHWRRPAIFLGRHFLDYEPGIHYSQAQMQSGTTGINTVRIYSPAKQVKDHDPTGVFIRQWVPELMGVPDAYIANPECMPRDVQRKAGCRIGKDYPAPIVDHKEATDFARKQIYGRRREARAREESQQIYAKHGSRRRPSRGN